MKNILTESTKSNFKVLEHKPKNVLKRIQGVLSDFKSNRNGRIYPRELWENVLNSEYVKEMIESHGLVGELDHPEERLEISLQNVSHVINDMWIEGDQLIGTIDILPTPSGKIVSELLDYGTDIGISSRGAGSVGAGNIVDSDYQFVTFDFVARPSCEAARLNMIVESVQPEIDSNSDDKVKSILEGYKSNLNEGVLIDKYKLNGDDKFRYMMLSRLQSDCKYVLGAANGYLGHLWVKDDPETHCALMRELYNSLPEKPEWCSLEDIDNYEKEMLKYKNKLKESDEDYETYTDYSGDVPVERQRHTEDYCTTAAFEFVMDRLPDNWRELPEDELEDLVRHEVNTYNDANYEPEYAEEDFYGDEANPDNVFKRVIAYKNNKIYEAAMSDQEVFKKILTWYKQQIEAGNMSLNQCYQLLSDKAKVSLNKMVDQSKIKESLVNSTINKLINESIELNNTKINEGVYTKAIDPWIDPRSEVRGWKVKVLNVFPDEYAGSTTAEVELFDPKGNSQGTDTIYIHRQKVKIGETYDAYIDGIMSMPRIKGVSNFTSEEVPDMKKVNRDLYL